MAKNTGKGYRQGAVRGRSEFQLPSGNWMKRDTNTGQFLNVKSDGKQNKGVRNEK